MSLPSFGAYCQQDPATFYLGHPRGGDFASLADAVIAAGSRPPVEFPVHSHTLAQHSTVLRSVFAAQAGGDLAAPRKGTGRVRLSEPFKSFSSRETACFLRFIYWPEQAVPGNFAQLGDSLHGVIKLAHQLDVPSLLAKLDAYLCDTVTDVSVEEAVRWTHLAEQCHLDLLRVRCIRQLAQGLAACSATRYPSTFYGSPSYHLQPAAQRRSGKGSPAVEALADVSELKGLREDALLGVLAACVASMRRCGSHHIPSASDLEEALLPK
ncbi:hypothetical protein ABPG77_011037 [Micractinium sp. CCAP 211/92]